jgi:hypothetical protein
MQSGNIVFCGVFGAPAADERLMAAPCDALGTRALPNEDWDILMLRRWRAVGPQTGSCG